MTHYYCISDNTAYKRGMPEVCKIVSGVVQKCKCSTCGAVIRYPFGNLQVRLGDDPAKMWPDAIACMDYPCFVVSDPFVSSMERCGVRVILGGKVEFVEPLENGLSLKDAPSYFWIDGTRHLAGKMDFEASGFVNNRFCSECGRRLANISLTYDRQHYSEPPPPYVVHHDESSGLDLFTTDLSPTAFFCTEKVFECAKANKLTNLSFRPIEQGVYGKPEKY